MVFRSLRNKVELENFFRKNAGLNIYQIGDLDSFYWNYTKWYGLKDNNKLKAVMLLYTALELPVLLALSPENELCYLKELVSSCIKVLPSRFYSHLSPGVDEILKKDCKLNLHGHYCKMLLTHKRNLEQFDLSLTTSLRSDNLNEINTLYKESYPENSFDHRMLETNMYFGIRINGRLICVAGVHVYSEQYKVAALGNITTHPDFRGKGYGTITTARLCKELLNHIGTIGLNVGKDNNGAIRCYEKLGFEIIAPYNEIMVEKK
jgi:RimJ/RimL family protein N-acetyltransferase